MPGRVARVRTPHRGQGNRAGKKATVGKSQTLAEWPDQLEASTGNEREDQARADPGSQGQGIEDQGRMTMQAPGKRETVQEGIEWARGARRSPCTRKDSGPGEAPARGSTWGRSRKADRRPRGLADQTRSQGRPGAAPGKATRSTRTQPGPQIAERESRLVSYRP